MPIVHLDQVAASGSNWHRLARNADEFLIPNRTDRLTFLSTGLSRNCRSAAPLPHPDQVLEFLPDTAGEP
jgi:hypothetical protein